METSDFSATLATASSLTGQFLLGTAQVTSQIAPVPWMAGAVSVAINLVALFAKANSNKNALKQLEDRCLSFLEVLRQRGTHASAAEQSILATGAESTLWTIFQRMDKWCSMSAFKRFLGQDELATAIQDCHLEINDCMTKLQISAALESQEWQSAFEANNERDKTEMISYLSDIRNSQQIIESTQQQHTQDIKFIMKLMQENLSTTSSNNNRGLETNLYHLQKSSGKLLDNMELKRGEVRRIGQYPVSGTGAMDIWEGIYLNEEKVAIKILRAVHATPKSRQRFIREVDIWKRVWEVDQGRHILPLYGFCQNDGPFPYLVSPWQPNGTADKYVARYEDVDHRALIRGIAEGVNVLHTMQPPVVHGDLKGVNIVIDGSGKPLLANFGFSRIVEDITGVALTQSTGISNSQRWLAPELCFDKGKLNTTADVYAFAMTALELMTHAMPWANIRHTTQVLLKVVEGEKPSRPSDEATIARGLDDHFWEVLEKCWQSSAMRPTMIDILRML
ncbi:kinase-like domain-containing protein [Phlebopus sp. FC_14]|nr:kinase-like domain-containing protein [Phlebopus sp. FC_14]